MLLPFFSKSKKNQNDNSNIKQNNEYISLIKQTFKQESNDYCVECGKRHPQYISINNSIFLCKECILNHLQLSQEASTIIKNDLKILTLNEIQYIYNGGNQKLLNFVKDEFPELTKFEPQMFYNTKAMDYYRKRLKYLTEGGEEPIKPSINEAYSQIKKNEENDLSDIEMEVDEIYNNMNKNQKDDTFEKDDDILDKNLNINNTGDYDKNYTPKIDDEKNGFEDKIKKNYINIKNNNVKNSPNNIFDENFTKKLKDFNKVNIDSYKNNLRYSRLSKNIKYKKNYNNFDNESYNFNNYSTNKTCDTIEISNSNFKNWKNRGSKDNSLLKNGILSPQPITNFQNSTTETNKIYSKPKGISFFQKYKYRTKSNYPEDDSNNEIKIVFNINEFNLDNKKNNNINKNKTKDEKTNESNYYEKIKNTKINHYDFITKNKKEKKFEKKKINQTYTNDINESQNKIVEKDDIKNMNYSLNDEIKVNKNEKEKNKNKIAVNISNVNIIKNINNINININGYKDKNKIPISNKTNVNSSQNNENLLLTDKTYKKQKLITKKEINNIENLSKEKKKSIAKKLIEYKKNNIHSNTETKTIPKNPIRNYQTFELKRSLKKETTNFKYNQKLLLKTDNNSSEKKNYSFYNLREKYKNKEKENINKRNENEKNKLLQRMNDKLKNKSMDEPYKGLFKESIRNKYKKKNFIK